VTAPGPRTARDAVAAYRAETMLAATSDLARDVLRRLEADAEGKVTAALNNRGLRGVPPSIMVFVLVQSVDLAQSRAEVIEASRVRADEHRSAAAAARALDVFCRGRVPLELAANLPALAACLADMTNHYDSVPRKLQINRKGSVEAAAVLLALRHFAAKLRRYGVKRLPCDACRWLVGAALGCDISAREAAEGLRSDEMGIRAAESTGESPECRKPLKLPVIPA
jgi:hypothetical protein